MSGLNDVFRSRVTCWVVKRELFNGAMPQKITHRANSAQNTFQCLHIVSYEYLKLGGYTSKTYPFLAALMGTKAMKSKG